MDTIIVNNVNFATTALIVLFTWI